MSHVLQQVWPAASLDKGRNRSQESQRGGRGTDSQRKTLPVPRTFAEFPFHKSWQEIAIHAQRLDGTSRIGLFGKGDDAWLRFAYMGESFGIQDGNHRLTLTVDDADCPEAILASVQSHFAPLFSKQLED